MKKNKKKKMMMIMMMIQNPYVSKVKCSCVLLVQLWTILSVNILAS